MTWQVAAGIIIGLLPLVLAVGGLFVFSIPHPEDVRIANERAILIGLAMIAGSIALAIFVVAKAFNYVSL